MNIKALALVSGGLDSILAARIVMDHNVDIEAITFTSVFYSAKEQKEGLSASGKVAQALGIKLTTLDISEELKQRVKNPRYGYGAHLNPCLDCHILMCQKAGEFMHQQGAQFLVTGEVVGERPKSQKKRDLLTVEKQSGYLGLIVRPLSALCLEPTIPEQHGWVDRTKLYGITGRSRKEQFRLAAEFGITDFLTPAGGCLLTDISFSRRLGDLIDRHPDFDIADVPALKIGRHFKVSDDARLVVARTAEETEQLKRLARSTDILLHPAHVSGPVAIVRGEVKPENIEYAARIVARYSKGAPAEARVIAIDHASRAEKILLTVLPVLDTELEKIRI